MLNAGEKRACATRGSGVHEDDINEIVNNTLTRRETGSRMHGVGYYI